MAAYRDELEASRLRIETLEAKLAERDAALAARDAELRELDARAGRGRATHPSPFPVRPDSPLGLALGAGLVALMTSAVALKARQQHHFEQVYGAISGERARACEAEVGELRALLKAKTEVANKAFQDPPGGLARESHGELETMIARASRHSADDARRAGERATGAEFDLGAASRSVDDMAERARRRCRQGDAPEGPLQIRKGDAPEGPLQIKVTFRPEGRVDSVSTGQGLEQGEAGTCLRAAIAGARVAPFEGPPVVVTKSFTWR